MVEVNVQKTRVVGRPFKKNNPGGPGRPRGSFKAMLKGIPNSAEGERVVRDLLKACHKGSVTAIRLLIERCEGLPVQPVSHEGEITIKVVHV
jgi:hypothetical protein